MIDRLITRLKQMALTPKQQLKQLLIGTLGAFISMILILFSSQWEIDWLFYLLALITGFFIAYAIPGYIGIWVWRMRKFLFDFD